MGAGCSSDDTEKLDKISGSTPVIKPAAKTDTRQKVVVDTHTDSFAAAESKNTILIILQK